jgi:hypothetical protein
MNCPKCGGDMFDEAKSKFWNGGKTKEGKAKPAWKCKDKANCDGVVWGNTPAAAAPVAQPSSAPVNGEAGKEKLDGLFKLYDQCFGHAFIIAQRVAKKQTDEGTNTLQIDVAAMAATMYIQANMAGIKL